VKVGVKEQEERQYLLIIPKYFICELAVEHFFVWANVGRWFFPLKWLSSQERHLNFGGKNKENYSVKMKVHNRFIWFSTTFGHQTFIFCCDSVNYGQNKA